VVEEANLTQNISTLLQALGDKTLSFERPPWIKDSAHGAR
jgi:DNA-binding winged helix-turn-helix (wHTH) protein